MSAIITLLTDFGDFYVAQMKGEILRINPEARIIDITHQISPENVRQGAFILKSISSHFPENTIHVAVVDPGVGTERKPIVVKAKETYFVGPDNGLLIPAARAVGDFMVYEISKIPTKPISRTFHGRDIFAPAAALLSMKEPKDFGAETEPLDLNLYDFKIFGDRISAEVLHVDRFGNVITNIPYESVQDWMRYGDKTSIKGETVPFLRTYAEIGPNKPLIIVGSHGNLELSVNLGNASSFFDVCVGDKISIVKE